MRSIHKRLRLAQRIHAAYAERARQSALERQIDWDHLEHRFHLAQQQHQLVEKARERGWHLAARSQQAHLQSVLRAVAESLREAQEKMLLPPPSLPSLNDLLAELQNLDVEFDDVVLDQKTFLAVQTDSIVLEGIDLGRFSIRFHWVRLAQRDSQSCFDVVALDPNSASSNEDVTHPHVRSQQLCAGDATLPLQKLRR
jgi:hypothetical protein